MTVYATARRAAGLGMADGHFDWAKEIRQPLPALVQRVVHFTAAHEQRLNFPLTRIRAQIVRTQPAEHDATILKSYALATSNAVNYIYVENQYVQLAEWVRFIKAVRQRQERFAAKAKARPKDIPALHLMVVMPRPERGAMVPRTYDALAQMGQAETVCGYHERVEDLRQGRELDGVVPTGQLWLKSSLKATPPQAQIQKELDRLNVKTLVAMLIPTTTTTKPGTCGSASATTMRRKRRPGRRPAAAPPGRPATWMPRPGGRTTSGRRATARSTSTASSC